MAPLAPTDSIILPGGLRLPVGQGLHRELVEPGSLVRTDIDFDLLSQHLKPLGNATRLKLLHLLTQPQYLEEVASRLRMSRQGARKHLDELVELGAVRKQLGRREFGPVTEYVLNHQRLFLLQIELGKLGGLKPAAGADQTQGTIDHAMTLPGARKGPASTESQLVIVRGLDEGKAFTLADQPGRLWRLGRGKDVEVRLDYDPFLSNRHAEIRRERDGFLLVDAFSRNGTFLNWRRLDRGQSVRLDRGDVVGVGKSLLVFQTRPPT